METQCSGTVLRRPSSLRPPAWAVRFRARTGPLPPCPVVFRARDHGPAGAGGGAPRHMARTRPDRRWCRDALSTMEAGPRQPCAMSAMTPGPATAAGPPPPPWRTIGRCPSTRRHAGRRRIAIPAPPHAAGSVPGKTSANGRAPGDDAARTKPRLCRARRRRADLATGSGGRALAGSNRPSRADATLFGGGTLGLGARLGLRVRARTARRTTSGGGLLGRLVAGLLGRG